MKLCAVGIRNAILGNNLKRPPSNKCPISNKRSLLNVIFSSKDPYFNKHPLLISTLLQKWYSLHGVDWLDFSKLCGLLSHLNVILKKKKKQHELLCSSRKCLYSCHWRDWNFLGEREAVGGSIRPKNLKKCMKLYWNFQRGGGVRKNPFHGGGMGIFWNYRHVHIFTAKWRYNYMYESP